MRALVPILALTLAACGGAPEEPPVANNVAMIQEALEREADNMEAMADATSNKIEEQALENAADVLEDLKGDIEEVARNAR